MSLDRLLRPKSIAVLGGVWARNVIRECNKMGYQGELWPIHPEHTSMEGVPCFNSLDDLPHPPDATFIGINRHQTIKTVAALSAMDAGGAVCFASGFSEAVKEDESAEQQQQKLIHAADTMPILGPNCYGFINYLDGALLWPDQHGGERVDKGVAIITQSSNIVINMTMQRYGLPIAYVVTTGNQAQQGVASLGESLLNDSRVTALGLYIEGFSDLPAYESLARTARRLGKPVVTIKVGRSPQAQAATVSHTASLAGSFAGSKVLLDRLGFPRVNSIPAFLEALRLMHVCGRLPGNRVLSMSCSGGEAALMADAGLLQRVEFPELASNTKQAISEVLGPKVHVANPLDYHTYIWNDAQALQDLFTAAMDADVDITLLIIDTPRQDRCDATDWLRAIQCFIQAKRNTGAAAGVVSLLPENLPEDLAQELIRNGITPFTGLNLALEAIAAAASVAKSPLPNCLLIPPTPPASVGRVMNEAEAKYALSKHDIPIPPNKVVRNGDEAVQAAELIGYPIVVKGLGIAHKTEHGAVFLNVHTPDETRRAISALSQQCDTFLVEEFVGDSDLELLVGVVSDPSTGFLLTLGAGGTNTEILKDRSHRLLPIEKQDVLDALQELAIWPLLNGYRGRRAIDVDKLADVILKVASFVAAHQSIIQELEINPLLIGENHLVAADALIRVSE
ncbi:MAG: acetate--CoA ligase family protein [Pseudomonadota bacterium]